MTYDPRNGQSPYLGMDVDEDGGEQVGGEPAQASPQSAATAYVSRGQASHARAKAGQSIPATERRDGGPRRGVAPQQRVAAVGAGARDASLAEDVPLRRPVPSPPQQRMYAEPPATQRPQALRGPSRFFLMLGSLALRLLSLAARLGAIVLAALVVACAVLTDSRRYLLLQALNATSVLIPSGLLGRFVTETPLGGALRGDLIIMSIALFLIDWLCLVYATSLSRAAGREG